MADEPHGDEDSVQPDRRTAGPSPDEIIRTCPNCGARLVERSCKLMCPEPSCGFFLSCADYT